MVYLLVYRIRSAFISSLRSSQQLEQKKICWEKIQIFKIRTDGPCATHIGAILFISELVAYFYWAWNSNTRLSATCCTQQELTTPSQVPTMLYPIAPIGCALLDPQLNAACWCFGRHKQLFPPTPTDENGEWIRALFLLLNWFQIETHQECKVSMGKGMATCKPNFLRQLNQTCLE